MQDAVANARLWVIMDRHATPGLRDRLFSESPELTSFLHDLVANKAGPLFALCTCERFLLLQSEPTVEKEAAIHGALSRWLGGLAKEALALMEVKQGPAALRYLFSVAAGLESRILGEPEVLGQVRAAQVEAEALGLLDPSLQHSLEIAARLGAAVRRETRIGTGPTSLTAAALRMARDVHGSLASQKAFLVGSGDTGEVLAAALVNADLSDLTVLHVNERRGGRVAARLGTPATFLPGWNEAVARCLPVADLIVFDVGQGRTLLDVDQARAALRQRRFRPLVILDAGVPRDVDPRVNELDSVYLFDLSDLELLALGGRDQRVTAIGEVEALIEKALKESLGA